jgi:hypothetical protein
VGLKGLHRLDERRLAMESTFRGPARTALGNQVHSEARNRQYIVNLSETLHMRVGEPRLFTAAVHRRKDK